MSSSPSFVRPIKVVLVTGASAGGIGHATALEFAKLGYKVAITGRDKQRLKETMRDLESAAAPFGAGPETNFLTLEVDLENTIQVDELIPQVIAKFGQLDILINNAGSVGKRKSLLDDDFYEDYLGIMQVNLLAPTRLAQLAAPHLLKAPHGGVIINVCSVADRLAFSSNASFCISKAGLSMLTKTLANTFEGKSVRVLTVSPGAIATNIVPGSATMGKLSTLAERSGTSKEVADVIVFLASDKASYMTGTCVDVDGGMCCIAGVLMPKACEEGCAL